MLGIERAEICRGTPVCEDHDVVVCGGLRSDLVVKPFQIFGVRCIVLCDIPVVSGVEVNSARSHRTVLRQLLA